MSMQNIPNVDDSIFTGLNINKDDQKNPVSTNALNNNGFKNNSPKTRKTAMNAMSFDFASTKMSDLVSPEHYQTYIKKVN